MDYEDYSHEDLDKLRRQAIVALGHIVNSRNWEDWKVIGQYIETGRQWAMMMSHSNQPVGVRYNAAINVWLANNPKFRDGIGKDERNDLMRCMENADSIAGFLQAQEKTSRTRQLVHPTSVWRAYKRHVADLERQAALEKADKAAAESVKGDDGTPFNIPIDGPSLLSKTDVNAWGIAVELRKTYGDEMAGHIARSLFKLLKIMEPDHG